MPSRIVVVGILVAALAPPCGSEIIERILAVLDGRPVLQSEVEVLRRVKGLEPRAALEALIDQRLMFREASRLPQATVTQQDEEQAYESLGKARPDASAIPEADLRRLARREAAVLKYVDFRFRPQIQISDEDVRRAYDAGLQARPDAPPFEAEAPRIRERLAREGLDMRIEAWIRELRSSAELRYNPE